MNGLEIIEWAVKKCAQEKLPPTDGNIMEKIRTWNPEMDAKERSLNAAIRRSAGYFS